MNSIVQAKSNWNWCLKVTWPVVSKPQAWDWVLCLRHTGYGTLLAEGKETRHIEGKDYVLEYPIKADFALIKAQQGDRWGNLVYRKSARNFGPIMAMAARCDHCTSL